ncbi:MAG TPA: hypothetical protein VN579_00770, partial [Bryobacteraceae bacterium]|nr:hypothetical protein [Bryobacteraceae bacterium]
MSVTPYSVSAIDAQLKFGTRLTLLEYVGSALAAVGIPSIGDGGSHPLSFYYSSLAAAQADYPALSLTSTWRGVAWGSVELAGIILQNAIYDSKVAELYVPRGLYQINTYIDIANRYLGGFRLIGAGCQSNSNSAFTAFYGNTGGVLFDLCGSEFIQFENFAILPGTSTIGILQGRTTDTAGFQSQYHHWRNVIVAMSHNPSANSGKGTFAVYNFACELGRYHNCVFQADNPYFASIVNPTPFCARRGDSAAVTFTAASPDSSVHVPAAPSFGSLGNLSFEGQCGFISMMNPSLAINGCENLQIRNGYFRNNTGVVTGASTTIAASIATGSHAVTPASMSPGGNAITLNQLLTVENSDGSNREVVVVTAVTGTTFTANFASAKTGPGIKVTYGDYTLAAINIIQGTTNCEISGTAEEFSKILYTRTISFNLDLKVTLGVANATVDIIDFDNVGGTLSTGLEGCQLRCFQGDFTKSPNLLGGTPAVLTGEVWLGLTQGINLTTGGTGIDLTVFAQKWAPAISLSAGGTYELVGPGRRKIVASAVSPTFEFSDLNLEGNLNIGNDLMVIDASNATPIVITVESIAHRLANGQQITSFAIAGNSAANGTFYAKTSGYAATQFALYSDAGLTVPVAGNGAYTGGGTVRGAGRQSLVAFLDAAVLKWYGGVNSNGSFFIHDQVSGWDIQRTRRGSRTRECIRAD